MKPVIAVIIALCLSSPGHCTDTFPDELITKMMQLNKLSRPILDQYLEYIYPPVTHPLTGALLGSEDMFNSAVPPEIGGRSLAIAGYVNVTQKPFNADPSGIVDATAAIQSAIDFARDHQMACFFPPGTYRVSNSIECLQKITVRENGRLSSADGAPCILIGDSLNRPVLFLAPNSPGFADPSNRKIILHVVNCNTAMEIKPELGPRFPQANISYNQLVRGINIRIGEGNAGAIGVRMQAAEGSSIQDMTIDATYGHTGMQGAAGSGGSHHNITVIGGRIGIDTRGFPPQYQTDGPGTQPGATMSSVTLRGQTETPAIIVSIGPFTAVGWHVETACPVAFRAVNSSKNYFTSQINLVDSIVEFSTPGVLLDTTQGAYLKNVYVSNAISVHNDVTAKSLWTRIIEYAVGGEDTLFMGKKGPYPITQPIVFAGGKKETLLSLTTEKPATGICEAHWWTDIPAPSALISASVRHFGAVGDGFTDDTKAIQSAVDAQNLVFLPKGMYRITDTIRLREQTRLVGVHHALSMIIAYDPFGALGSGQPKPMIDTPDDSSAQTMLAFVGIRIMRWCDSARAGDIRNEVPFYAVRWRAGERSIVRSPWFHRSFNNLSFAPTQAASGRTNLVWNHPLVRIEGNGGGRWYNFFIHGLAHKETPDFRFVRIAGTNRLSFYHFHAQAAESDYQCEVVGARNVSFFGVKTECETAFMRVRDATSIHIFGHAGWGSALPGTGLYCFSGGSDYLLSCFGSFIKDINGERLPWRKYSAASFLEWYPLIDLDTQFKMSPTERAVLYRR